MSDQAIKALLAEYENTAANHRTAQRLFSYLAAVAQRSTSGDDAGRLIAEDVFVKGDDINEWIDIHYELVALILKKWYRAARRHEQQRGEAK